MLIFAQRVWAVMRGYRLMFVVSVLAALAYTAMNVIPPLFIRQIIVWVTEGEGTATGLAVVVAATMAMYILRGVFNYIDRYWAHVAAYGALHRMTMGLYTRLQSLSAHYFSRQRTGELISRGVADMQALENFIAHAVQMIVLSITIPLGMTIVLFVINWQLALLVFVPVPALIWITAWLSPKLRAMWRGTREKLGIVTSTYQENLQGISVIRSFTRERERTDELREASYDFHKDIVRANKFTTIPNSAVELVSGVGMVLLLWFGGRAAMAGDLSAADLFLFIFYLALIYKPVLDLARANEQLQTALASSDRVFEAWDTKPRIYDKPEVVAPEKPRWDIEFQNVSFAYKDDLAVLRNMSFRVEEGEVVALVGPTGSGKTTTVNMIPRFYDPDEGAILVGGTDVRDLPLHHLRSGVAMVMQDVFLFNDTIRKNLLIGRPDATHEELVAAATAANAHDFIIATPNGYDTVIGERGIRLSGGEKQRISIARALLKDAPVLVLDEATSSVDVESEFEIQQALSRLAEQRTTLVIAHRLSTIRNADRIIFLREGRIDEVGSHDELLALDGSYARMHYSQTLTREWRLRTETPVATAGGS
ncbi:MAG: ABC transporter ATP-binding protein [Chloroflexi bacterium]|nr:ABC transporter ATP-binding protein [Chloroflexota bacterium]MCY3939357.1 ABC transporter ATP-binding protein [Chloroflexota bacterium]